MLISHHLQAVLMLPSPREWERDAVDDASYHRTLEFTPSEAGRTSIFCGVRATRDGAGRGVGRRKRRRAGRVMVLSFVPTMSLKNLLATRADVRLACPALTKGVTGGVCVAIVYPRSVPFRSSSLDSIPFVLHLTNASTICAQSS